MQAKERQASSGSKWIGATFLPCLCFPRAQLCASGLSTTCSTQQHKAACAARVSTQSPPALCFHHGSARLLALPPLRGEHSHRGPSFFSLKSYTLRGSGGVGGGRRRRPRQWPRTAARRLRRESQLLADATHCSSGLSIKNF